MGKGRGGGAPDWGVRPWGPGGRAWGRSYDRACDRRYDRPYDLPYHTPYDRTYRHPCDRAATPYDRGAPGREGGGGGE